MKIAICDDEKVYRENTEQECRAYFNVEKNRLRAGELVIRSFSTGKEIMESAEQFDILFLDVEMPENDGICVKEFFEKNKKQTRIVFLTSHEERALDAFGKNVLFFLRKPLNKADFQKAMDKVLTDVCGEVLEIEESGEYFAVSVRQIRYIEAEDKYTTVYMEQGSYIFRKTMKFWEEALPEQDFCRIHKSFLVNLEYFVKEQDEIVLEKNKRVKISRKNKDGIMEKYKGYLRRKAEMM